ncbi:hypothetical protein [Phaeobacter sp. B1627]|uniref:hypothetical protein n=1 Tax=Phaeobacter sp. B1627 TaxID=2583809 RepID=UPI00111B28F1|nr:hypothetical protein [Phaeobacter sp. B1627]TNJ42302.1 hypothetical protein FGE21_11510 [Phaeobacter sp. B1627]
MEKKDLTRTDDAVFVETLVESDVIKVERVVTRGQASEAAAFCPQEALDFLIMLKGTLELEYKGEKETVSLRAGDSIMTEPGEENRVEATREGQESVWVKISAAGKNRPGIFPAPDAEKVTPRVRNIFRDTAMIESLAETESVRIERVISAGQVAGAPCEQGVHEWLMLVSGGATIAMEDEKFELSPGDHIFIPAKTKSQVLETASFEKTIWVAAYWKGEPSSRRAMQGKFPVSTGY